MWNIDSEALIKAIHLPDTCQSVQHLQFIWQGPDSLVPEVSCGLFGAQTRN